jgi:hypothetical protein
MKKAGATLVGLALLIVTAQAQYAPLCRQQCYAFCTDMGRGEQCRSDCAGKPACSTVTGKSSGREGMLLLVRD